jgi:hypothetical protein
MKVDDLKPFTWYAVYGSDGKFLIDNMLIINEVSRDDKEALFQGFLFLPPEDLQFRRGGWLFSLPLDSEMDCRKEYPKHNDRVNRQCIVELFHTPAYETGKTTQLI